MLSMYNSVSCSNLQLCESRFLLKKRFESNFVSAEWRCKTLARFVIISVNSISGIDVAIYSKVLSSLAKRCIMFSMYNSVMFELAIL